MNKSFLCFRDIEFVRESIAQFYNFPECGSSENRVSEHQRTKWLKRTMTRTEYRKIYDRFQSELYL